jgi:hypothetical protein
MAVPRLSHPSLLKPPEAHIRNAHAAPHKLKRYIDELAEENKVLCGLLDGAVAGVGIGHRKDVQLGEESAPMIRFVSIRPVVEAKPISSQTPSELCTWRDHVNHTYFCVQQLHCVLHFRRKEKQNLMPRRQLQ